MGKWRARTKTTKEITTHKRTIWKGVEREVIRNEYDAADERRANELESNGPSASSGDRAATTTTTDGTTKSDGATSHSADAN